MPPGKPLPLTDRACLNAKCPQGRPYQRYSDSGGLYLEVSKTGAKCWRWKYRYAGKEKWLALGIYPAVTLAQARKIRDEARVQLGEGVDSSQAKREAPMARLLRSETLFENVACLWWKDWSANKAERHAGYVLKRLEADAFPAIGSKVAAELRAPDFVRMAKPIEQRSAGDIARRILQTSGQVMCYAQ